MIGVQNLSGDEDLERLDRSAFGKGGNVHNGGGDHDGKQERAGFPSSLGSQEVMRVGRLEWHTIGEEEGERGWRLRLGLLVVLVTLAGAVALVVLGGKREEVEAFLQEKQVSDRRNAADPTLKGPLHKREIPDDAKWIYDAWDVANSTDRLHLVESWKGAVSSDVGICSEIGVELMHKGGNAVDAIIGTAACIGTVNMFASGVGGGGFAVVRTANGESRSFNFREMACKAAHQDMYHGNESLAQNGGLAIAIPGEVDGFWRMHQRYGSLPWEELWEPSIKLNKHGFLVTPFLAARIAMDRDYFHRHRDEWEFLFSSTTGELLVEGEIMKRPQLAKTLKAIARKDGLKTFYEGYIAESLAKAAQLAGGVLTKEDFREYFTLEEETLKTRAFGREIVTCQPPCSGPVIIEGLNIANDLDLTDPGENVTLHRLVEIMKWMGAGRTRLGDPSDLEMYDDQLVKEIMTPEFAESVRRNISDNTTYPWQHYHPSYEESGSRGTAHISVIDEYGIAAALTTTVNLPWGAHVHDTHTGIILNSEMDDFSIPGQSNAFNLTPSIYNYIKPFKRPLSSMSPTIVSEMDGKPGLVIGASGGSRIITAVVECIVKNYLWGYDLLDVVKSARVYHQLVPGVLYVEDGISDKAIESLKEKGHIIQEVVEGPSAVSVVGAVQRGVDGKISAVADWWRKGGQAAGL